MKSKFYLIVTSIILITNYSFSQLTKLHDFNGAESGATPRGSLYSDNTYLFGMTTYGGDNNLGAIFKLNPDGTGYSKLLDFDGVNNGSLPLGNLISDGTYLFGMTQQGGANDLGTIFKILPDGTGYTKLFDFTGSSTGSYPNETLISDGTFLYGTTPSGGSNNLGVIFKIKLDGTNFQKLLDFNGTSNGSMPQGALYLEGVNLFGTTGSGGTANSGTIFRILTDGTGYTKIKDFLGSSDGNLPVGQLILIGEYFYGTTLYGGNNGIGTAFQIKQDGSSYNVIYDFIEGRPSNAFISVGPYFYGMTSFGGDNDLGTIYQLSHDGSNYSTLFSFDGTLNGSSPEGDLIILNDALYGITKSGGLNDKGIAFKFNQDGLGINNFTSSDFKIYPNPTSDILNIITSNNLNQKVEIIDALGKTVITENISLVNNNNFKIDLSNLEPGIYVIVIGAINHRVIKK